jgi:hypothetical protein
VATKAQCEAALRIYEGALRGFKNAVGCAIAPADARTGDDAYVVIVRVSKKIPFDEIEPDDLIPSYLQLVELSGIVRVPVRVVEGMPRSDAP